MLLISGLWRGPRQNMFVFVGPRNLYSASAPSSDNHRTKMYLFSSRGALYNSRTYIKVGKGRQLGF